MTFQKARSEWDAATRAWSRNECTDTMSLMKDGERMLFAGIDLICALEERAAGEDRSEKGAGAVIREALTDARAIIVTEREVLIASHTVRGDLATLDNEVRSDPETYDAALAKIDAALETLQ